MTKLVMKIYSDAKTHIKNVSLREEAKSHQKLSKLARPTSTFSDHQKALRILPSTTSRIPLCPLHLLS
jgi:hypothetical protein